MDFRSSYARRRVDAGFGKELLRLRTGERQNASLARLRERSIELKRGCAAFHAYSPERRYLIAEGLTFDLLASFYDVNSKSVMALRLDFPIKRGEIRRAARGLGRLGKPNLEVRMIGMQNGDLSLIGSVDSLVGMKVGRLVEVDLFGDQTRHVVIDLLTGKPYALLLSDRIYRPGELLNTMRREEFVSTASELKFL